MQRTLALALAFLALTACSAVAGAGPAPTPVPYVTPPALKPPVTAGDATPTAPPIAAATAAPVTAMSRSFALTPVGGSGAFGGVAVIQRNGFFTATVVVHGVVNGSIHTVHIHLGSCTNPYGGMHLTILGLLAGGPGNTGGLSATIAPVYLSTRDYVIVYATSSPIRIIACADLGAI